MKIENWMPEFVADVNTNATLLKQESYQLYMAAKKQAEENKERQLQERLEKLGIVGKIINLLQSSYLHIRKMVSKKT